MGEETKTKILREVRKDFLQELLEKGKRFDERELNEWRPVEVQKGAIPNAEGSALAEIGGTKVLAAVKFDIMTPFPDRPEEGVFMTGAEFVPFASPEFEAGPPREDAIEFARVVDRGIRSAEVIDVSKFFIEEGKVLGLFVDLWVLDHSGNLMDTGALAACAALLDTKVPKIEDGELIREESSGGLDMKYKPLATSFIKVGNKFLMDPSKDEEYAADMNFTIGTVEGKVSSIQKSGNAGLSRDDVLSLTDIAFEKSDELRKYL
ncbi:exosome complex protein Rrp42 [Candidatus Micrarchaeota archaeon]|nr:exosome complex protein Rrp42 [Candidatus Micrarchaeota archaeon]MBD3418385.1 exosome complex protein Rrp42 [Candidatus Micrarchaeota archaeon]